MKRVPLACFACLLILLLASCGQVDQQLVTKVKVVGPRWVELHQRLTENGHNIEVAKARFEKDFKEIEAQLPVVPDSLQDKKYKSELKGYQHLLTQKDSLAKAYEASEQLLTSSVTAFNNWEQEVMNGDVAGEAGLAKLEEYRSIQEQLGIEIDAQGKLLEQMFHRHNSILRFLAGLAQYHQNLDLKIE